MIDYVTIGNTFLGTNYDRKAVCRLYAQFFFV